MVHSPSGASVISSGPLHLIVVQLHVALLLPTFLDAYETPSDVAVEVGMLGILPAATAALSASTQSLGSDD
jgi:hypothetical protein